MMGAALPKYEDKVVVRILRFDDHFSLLFNDMSTVTVDYGDAPEPKLGETVSVCREPNDGSLKLVGQS